MQDADSPSSAKQPITAKRPRRRIVRRAVIALAGVVLLPVWYVGAWLVVSRGAHDGIIGGTMAARLAPVFAPVRHYSGRKMGLGSDVLYDVWWTVNPVGTPGVWDEFTPDQQLAPCNKTGKLTLRPSALGVVHRRGQ